MTRTPHRFTRLTGLAVILAVSAAVQPLLADEPAPYRVEAPPADKYDDFYQKYVSARGFPILASAKVSDYALLEAAYLIDQMLTGRDDVRQALIDSGTRFAIMAPDELTTQIPEHSDLKPSRFWDRRARGLGATPIRPAVSCGEENLLNYPGDPYAAENILIHEFAHAIHQMGLKRIDPEFQTRLDATFTAAMDEGLWKGKYAANNSAEYWAEGVQSWFGTNRENDHDHNHVNTRAELREYDPRLAQLIEAAFGDREWVYQRPAAREQPQHLAGYSPDGAPAFAWPEGLQAWYDDYQRQQRERSRSRGTAAPRTEAERKPAANKDSNKDSDKDPDKDPEKDPNKQPAPRDRRP